MEACEEVADTFSDAGGCAAEVADTFSRRLGSLNLTCNSQSFDPAFTFDTSSRSSSLRHCDSVSRSGGSEVAPHMPMMLAAVSPPPCIATRRHVAVVRRTSLPHGGCEPHPARLSTSDWSSRPPVAPQRTAAAGAAEASTSLSCEASCRETPPRCAGVKRRSCPEPLGSPQRLDDEQEQPQSRGEEMGLCGEVLPMMGPQSPTTSFASFAAALAAHYYADFGSIPDVPNHIEEVRLRASKRQRVEAVEQTADS